MNNLRLPNSSELEGADFRTGVTTYQIEISCDDEGYYFDIYKIDHVVGDNFVVKEYLPEAYTTQKSPFKTREDAIEAGKAWLSQKDKVT